MVNNAVVSHNSVNELYYLEEVDSTNTWAKANLDKFGPVGAVYPTSQTAGRGRRGRQLWSEVAREREEGRRGAVFSLGQFVSHFSGDMQE